MRRTLCLLLAVVMAASLCLTACGSSSAPAAPAASAAPSTPKPTANPGGPEGRPETAAAQVGSGELASLDQGVDAVLASVPLRTEMFLGSVETADEVDPAVFPKKLSVRHAIFDGRLGASFYNDTLSIGIGVETLPSNGELLISGDTMQLLPLESFEYGENSNLVNCVYTGEVIEFGIRAIPNGLELSRGGESHRYTYENAPALDSGLGVWFYRHPDYPAFEGMESFEKSPFSIDKDPKPGYVDSELREDSTMRLDWLDEGLTSRSAELVYLAGRLNLFGGVEYLFFTDGEQLYCYVSAYIRDQLQLYGNIDAEQQAKLSEMDEGEVKALAETQGELLDELIAAFEASGLPVEVDERSGNVKVDSALLYETNAYEVTPEGRDFLREVFSLYCSVLSQEKYDGFIAEVRVEGHADPSGDSAFNLDLSQKRADAVKEFCLSDECGLEQVEWLRPLLTALGRGDEQPVLKADGSVDMDASRRVELRFLINLD